MDKPALERLFEDRKSRYIGDWESILRFPSVSSEPERQADCEACARWLADGLKRIGFSSRLLPTASHPVVFAERQGAPEKPVVLFYGHYDVQPADPLDQWQSPPFSPTWRNGRLYARGAQDNKVQLTYVLKALEALIEAGAALPTIKLFIEGDEERGSAGVSEGLSAWSNELRADVLMVCDTGTVATGAPTIIMGLRGILHLTVTLTGPSHDLHSGMHGGVSPNPAQAMARLIASLHRPDGSIAIRDYYADVPMPSDEERRLANAVPFDAEHYTRQTGVAPVAGEKQFTPAERLGFRPSIDVNGLHAGYGGPGSKTIIPSSAMAKISARLTSGQNPEKCMEAIVTHLREQTPHGLQLAIPEKDIGGPALRLNLTSPLVARAKQILFELTGEEPMFLWEGASIPLLSRLSHVAHAEPLLVGMGAEEDRVHAPNESFSLEQFRRGFLYAGLLLSRL